VDDGVEVNGVAECCCCISKALVSAKMYDRTRGTVKTTSFTSVTAKKKHQVDPLPPPPAPLCCGVNVLWC